MLKIINFALLNFGPLIVFYAVNHFYGLRTAIITSIAVAIIEVIYMILKKKTITGFFKFTVVVTLIFGILDLFVATPVFFQYEPTLTNIITGIYFGMTLWSEKSFIQEWAEKKAGTTIKNPDAILRYRILTVVWTIYFFVKAGIYAYVSRQYSIEKALIFRSTVGTISFYGLLAVSIFFGTKIIMFFQQRGLLPSNPA